jgi:hypothetical protein
MPGRCSIAFFEAKARLGRPAEGRAARRSRNPVGGIRPAGSGRAAATRIRPSPAPTANRRRRAPLRARSSEARCTPCWPRSRCRGGARPRARECERQDVFEDPRGAVGACEHAVVRRAANIVRKALERIADRPLQIGDVRRNSGGVEADRARLAGNVDEVAGEALAMDVHVARAELRRDLAEMSLERRLALVHAERDAEDEQDDDRESEPHGIKIGSSGLRVKSSQAGRSRHSTKGDTWPSSPRSRRSS